MDACIVADPAAHIQKLSQIMWLAITSTLIALHLLFIPVVSCYFWNGVSLYAMSDEEHESCHMIGKSDRNHRLERYTAKTILFLVNVIDRLSQFL